ncbi:hypothetical protein C8Q78DRAFT_997180 [Trametes maxima]|nr:hypothetical protein C8Q78DRAFT_997180 [Trametes maxima]
MGAYVPAIFFFSLCLRRRLRACRCRWGRCARAAKTGGRAAPTGVGLTSSCKRVCKEAGPSPLTARRRPWALGVLPRGRLPVSPTLRRPGATG